MKKRSMCLFVFLMALCIICTLVACNDKNNSSYPDTYKHNAEGIDNNNASISSISLSSEEKNTSNDPLQTSETIIDRENLGGVNSHVVETTTTRATASKEYSRDGNYIYFGKYPQTRVTNSTVTSNLFTVAGGAGGLPTKSNSQNWTSYGYYENNNSTGYMWYIDLNYSGEKYRGVYLRVTDCRTIPMETVIKTTMDI